MFGRNVWNVYDQWQRLNHVGIPNCFLIAASLLMNAFFLLMGIILNQLILSFGGKEIMKA
jgi:hypothetical protein